MYVNNNLTFEGRKIKYQSFGGNQFGKTTVSILVTEEEKDAMIAQGWREKNFKYSKPNPIDPDDVPDLFLTIDIDYTYSEKKNNPDLAPKIYLLDGNNRCTPLSKDALASFGNLRTTAFEFVDIIARPYNKRDRLNNVWMGADPQVDCMWIKLNTEVEERNRVEQSMREKYASFRITDQEDTF